MPFIAPIIAAAIPIIEAGAAAWAAIGIIGQTVVMAGVGIASSYLLQKLMPTNVGDTSATGSSFQKQYGNSVPRQVIMGKVGIAGHDIYLNTYPPTGNPNSNAQQVFVLSDYYTTSLDRVWINGELATLGAPDAGRDNFRPVTSGPAAGYVHLRYYDGRQTAANNSLISYASPSGRWGSGFVGLGVSYIIAEIIYDKDNFNSWPDFFFEVSGAPLYNWRLDTTAGGSGPQRWNDVTTHVFSKNPIVMEYNFRRGLSVNGDKFCGMFMDASDLPLSKYTIAANICDELDVNDSLPRYECSIIVDCGPQTSHGQTIKALNLACGAMQVDGVAGSWPIVGSDQASAITFYDTDLVSTFDQFKYTAKQSMGSLVNSVYGQHISPNDQWSMVDYQEQVSDALVIVDRRTRDVGIDFPTVANHRQAETLASLYLIENRFEATATVMLRPRFQTLEVGDWVDWQSVLYGWTKTFLIVDRSLVSLQSGQPRNVVLRLQERDGSIYDGIIASVLPVIIPNAAPVYLSEVATFSLLAVAVTGDTGKLIPAIRASWDAIVDPTVTQVEIIYYPTAQPTALLSKTVNVDQIVVILNEGIVASTQYTVKTKLITNPPRAIAYSAGNTVTTMATPAVTMSDLEAQIRYQITTLQNQNRAEFDAFKALISSVLANEQGTNWIDKKKVRKQLAARSDAAFAAIDEVEIVAVDAALAIASLSTSVTAQFGSVNANITANTTALATINGYAAAQYSITLDVNGYATGFNLFNGGGGTSSTTFITDNFRVARPGSGVAGAPINVFDIGMIGGFSKIGIKGDLMLDGTLNATNAVVTGSVTASLMAADSITAGNAAIAALAVKSLNIQGNAVTVPSVTSFSGNTAVALATLMSFNLSIDTTGLSGVSIPIYAIAVLVSPGVGASGGSGINGTLSINGTQVCQAGGGTKLDILTLSGSLSVTGTGGVMSIAVVFQAGGVIATSNGTLFAMAAKR